MFGEIFLCEFPFTSGRTSKIRPALTLFDLRRDAIICRVTSVLHNGPLDVRLDDWASSGLLKASLARDDRILTAAQKILLDRHGVVIAADKDAIRTAWNPHTKLQ